MSNSENPGDFILQQLILKRPSNASSSSSSSYSSHPNDFVDPAIAAIGPSVSFVSTSPHQDHFPVSPRILLHQTAAGPPPGFRIPDSRIQADGRGFVGNEGFFEWNRCQLTFGSVPSEVQHRGSVGVGVSQSGERLRNSAVSSGDDRTAGQGDGNHRGLPWKELLNLNASGGNAGFVREGLGQLGANGAHQGFPQNGVGNLSYSGNNHGFSGRGFVFSDSRQESQRFQQEGHGMVGGSRNYQRFPRNVGETFGGSEDKEAFSLRRLGNCDSQGVFLKTDETDTSRRADLQNRTLNSAQGMGDRWGSRNERNQGEKPKERRGDGTINYFRNVETRSMQIVQTPNLGPRHMEFEGEGLDYISWADRQGSQKRENHHFVDMELSSSLRRAAAESRIHRRQEGKAWHEDKESVRLNNGPDDSDKIGTIMGSLVVSDDAPENHSRRRGDVYGFKGKVHGSVTRFRSRRQAFIYRSDLEMHTPCFLSIFESLVPSEEEKVKQKQLISMLETLVTLEWPKARLYLYGSCANTFGFPKSDIDVCLSIDDAESSKLDILLRLAEILKADKLQNVQALTRARVPIVKLMDPDTEISCDICINNSLAVVNTKLLRDYAQIDIRLRQLAFIVKHWAKARQVNETYRGTLSSYAYVVMCIHFLQLRSPSILPCLQKMAATYVVSVDGIECAYYDKVDGLKGFGLQNKETISQLLCAFFNYWAFEHDYANSVISIRTGRFLSKREKDWTRRIGNDRHLICIEDPFETSHDLGRVVDKFSIKVLRDEFERAVDILQHDPNPSVKLFEPFSED